MVFQDNLAVISHLQTYTSTTPIGEEIYPNFTFEYLGDPCLFEIENRDIGKLTGRLISDLPKEFIKKMPASLIYYRFPVAEYVYLSYNGSYGKISTAYQYISSILSQLYIEPIGKSIEVFPNGYPKRDDAVVAVDIWIPTNAPTTGDRLSTRLPEAFPHRKFNFYKS
ncbi:MAG: GyrI-like domain-containing protein [Candidatus Kariarchaeaceae archaeon]